MYQVFLFVLLVLINIQWSLQEKKCVTQKNLQRIPVEKEFDMERFAGTWYTVSRTKVAWGDNTYESASIEFSENVDGTFTYSLTGQQDNKCMPVETGALQPTNRGGQFLLKGPDSTHEYPTMVVSYTNYEMAMVYFCFRYRPGRKDQCQRDGWQAEIMSRSTKPKKKDVNEYLRRLKKRLCVPKDDMFDTKPGVCKIPEILAQAKEREIAQPLVVDPKRKHCAVNNIPTQEGFQLSEMEGLWYEIARTRFTFNKMESVISYHRYDVDNNVIKSFYTGTTQGNCSTPIQGTSRTKQGRNEAGDMEGKIDGDFFAWSPLKILYVDANYLMFYACYSGDSDAPCLNEMMEVTLAGRTLEISDKEKTKIYKILPKICVDPADMIDTVFAANCTALVENVIKEKEIDPSSCFLDSIPTHSEFDDISMLDEWFLYAYSNYSDYFPLLGNILNISKGPAESLVIKHADIVEGSWRRVNDVYARKNCLDKGDYVLSLPDENNGGWVFGKILYQDDNTFVALICTQRNLDGRCNLKGVQVFIYTRNQTVTEYSEEEINKALKSACIDPDDMILVHDWCDFGVLDLAELMPPNDICDIDNIAIFNDIDDFDQTKIYGYWYEIEHSSGIYNDDIDSFTAYFTSDNNATLQIYYSGTRQNGSVIPVERATAIPRCLSELNGDYLTEVPDKNGLSRTVSFAPMKVLFTDYDVLLTYICQDILPSGQCSKTGAHLRLWSRNTTMDPDTREYVIDFATWACVDIFAKGYKLVPSKHDSSVLTSLQEYVLENVEITETEDVVSNVADDQQADEMETEYDDFDDSLQRYLDMDDEEFYGAQRR